MAEVEKISSAAIATATPAEIPAASGADAGAVELGTSPTQERSSNSHPHDSEYDTAGSATDLDDGEDYDDEDDMDDDDDGESITDDDDDDEEDDDDERLGGNQEKVDAEAQKKVDEDRSNPQYIPKRGTFYEHDDRTAEGEADGVAAGGESGEVIEGGVGTGGNTKTPQSPTISQASKTMKKWQAASGVERWSHDRFDASEQAPKSKSELVNAYGYDIRNEVAPPRARRRRRYGRGPSKYSRNWEDENAYLKASNKERKPPRAGDFPALNERSSKVHKTPRVSGTHEEKENRMERRQAAAGVSSGVAADKNMAGHRPAIADERRERTNDGKGSKNQNYGRQGAAVGRQAAMEFKQKQRGGQAHGTGATSNSGRPIDAQYERQSNRPQTNSQINSVDHAKQIKVQPNTKYMHANQNDTYNNNSNNSNYQQLSTSQQHQQQQQQQQTSMRQPMSQQKPTPTSNLSQRLQQVQNRNDPSHVGSVQMHALATQNQLIGQQQQQQQTQAGNMLITPQQQQQQQQQAQAAQQLPQEQRGPPKRYSSLRRSQHEAQHIAEQHQLQQLHLQQQQQQQPLLLQDHNMLQANLMQLYHQENIQAQMQALQVSQAPTQTKHPAYTAVPPNAQPQPQATTTYYVATPDAYAAATATPNAQGPPPAAYTQQPPPNYLPQAQAETVNTTLATAAAVSPYAAAAVAPPVPVPPTAGAATAAGNAAQGTPNANANYPNYQNYNTVGGTTYFVPPAQATTRPVVLPQRRPTNAIPILPPSEKNKQQRAAEAKEEARNSGGIANAQSAALGSAENIDHIIDNMFVQRPAFQPPQNTAATTAQTRKSATPPNGENSIAAADAIGNVQQVLTTTDDSSSSNNTSNISNTSASSDKLSSSSNNEAVAVQE